MIILKTLTWSNCFSYGVDNSIDLSSEKITQILGTNGVGKSSIPLILEEVLFNKNSKGIKKADIANRVNNAGYSINLKFSKDADEYEIDLARKSSLKIKFLKNGEDISSHTATNTYKTIEEVIAIDFKTFSQVVYQNTNASLNFLTATDSNRKKFLIDLLGLEKYVNIFEVFKSLSRETEVSSAGVESVLDRTQKWLDDNRLTDTTPKDIQNLPVISENDQNEISNLIVEIKNISEKNKKISTNNTYKKLLKELESQRNANASPGPIVSYDAEQSEIGSLRQVVVGSDKFIKKIQDLEGVCPTCEQPVDEALKDSMLAAEQEKSCVASWKIEELQTKIATIKKENAIAEDYERIEREWSEAFRSIDSTLPAQLLDEAELRNKLEELRSKVNAEQAKIAKIEVENQKAAAHNSKIEVITEQTCNLEEQVKELTNQLDEISEKKANLEILKKAFSTNGLIAYKIENLVKELEELVNNYLAELSDGRFTLEFVVSNDKLNVEITDNGKIVDILALSSGELARVNTATLIAIRKLMSSISSSQINVLFLDEVINVLDDIGREKLVEVLLSEEELNTYLVSHGWSHPLLNKLEVKKTDEISEII